MAANLDVSSITMGAFTGTLTFATNNNNITVGTFSGTGAGVRTFNMGNGTWTLTATGGNVWDLSTVTNLTFSANSSTLLFQGSGVNTSQKVFASGGLTYNIVQINDPIGAGNQGPFSFTGSTTIATLTLTAVRHLQFGGGFTTTVTNAFSLSGTSTIQVLVNSQSPNSVATVSVGAGVTMSWVALENIVKAGAGSITATNSFDLGGNSGMTITAPSGVGGRIISG